MEPSGTIGEVDNDEVGVSDGRRLRLRRTANVTGWWANWRLWRGKTTYGWWLRRGTVIHTHAFRNAICVCACCQARRKYSWQNTHTNWFLNPLWAIFAVFVGKKDAEGVQQRQEVDDRTESTRSVNGPKESMNVGMAKKRPPEFSKDSLQNE